MQTSFLNDSFLYCRDSSICVIPEACNLYMYVRAKRRSLDRKYLPNTLCLLRKFKMFFYVFSTVFLFTFGLIGTYGKNKEFSFIVRILVFLYLLFFSAIRFGIGTDYPHYEFYYHAIENGNTIYKFTEPIFYYLNFFCIRLELDFKVFIAICSVLTHVFFFRSVNKESFVYEVLLFYSLIYIQSYCLIRQMLACTISIYALKTKFPKWHLCLFWLIIAALIHYTFWMVVFLFVASKYLKFPILFVVCLSMVAFLSLYFTDFLRKMLVFSSSFLPIKLNEGYFQLIRRIGVVVLTRYVFMLLFLYLIAKLEKSNYIINILFFAIFLVEIIGTRMLIFASRFPQTFYAAFFLIFTKKNNAKISALLCKKYAVEKYAFIIMLLLTFFILYVQLLTGFHLNNVVPYQWIF